MITPDGTNAVQGDEDTGDGHYRDKRDPRTQTAGADLDPDSLLSRQAQNPFTLDNLRVGSASEDAAGIPAIWNTMLYGVGEMGPIRATEAFLKVNHVYSHQ